jgi:hypothetical protein
MPRMHVAVAVLCLAFASLLLAAPAWGQTVVRGTSDGSICSKGARDTGARVSLLATKLRAGLLRFDLEWPDFEERRGVYDAVFLKEMAKTIHAAATDGLEVIVTLFDTPKWASDRTLWRYALPGQSPGVYRKVYPPSLAHLDDLEAFAKKLSSTFAGDVTGYECRNEPNGWMSLYPQRTPSDDAFGVRRYAAMLTAFSKGVRAGDPDALVIAGATSPVGRNDRFSTSPQRFARLLKSMVPSAVYDAYSHHPYTVGGARHIEPEAMPNDPTHTVSLGNISALLKIFPDKPFYISEYGYNTRPNLFFGVHVSQITQAVYLTRAYRYAERFPQIKALVWFPYRDWPDRVQGTWSGLVTAAGVRKRSWYSFAGGNSLTLQASPRDDRVRLSGLLASETLGALPDKSLVVYMKRTAEPWHAVKVVKTSAAGSYVTFVKVSGAVSFRVAWRGVVGSETVSVGGG